MGFREGVFVPKGVSTFGSGVQNCPGGGAGNPYTLKNLFIQNGYTDDLGITNYATGRSTIKRAGFYGFRLSLHWDPSTNGNYRQLGIGFTGTKGLNSPKVQQSCTFANVQVEQEISMLSVPMNVGEEVWAYCEKAGTALPVYVAQWEIVFWGDRG